MKKEKIKDYSQIVTLYGTLIIKAKNYKEAEEKIGRILNCSKVKLDDGEFILGDFERETDIR